MESAKLLTPRQLEVLELMAKGLTNKEIAGVLGIAPGTVKVHVSAVIEALEVTNRTEAAVALQALQPEPGDTPGSAPPVPGFGARPAIAVLPFDALSPDPADEFFADALVEDLTTRLAAGRWFPVIARNSAFAWRGRSIDVATVSRELGARYVIEGSARRAGQRMRINVQLIDGETGRHVLAEKYDRELDDVFAVQDEIVDCVYGALEPALGHIEGLRAMRKPVESLSAWEHVQRGMLILSRQDPATGGDAIEHFERAIAEDPEFAGPYAGLALAQWLMGVYAIGSTQAVPRDEADLPNALTRAAGCFQKAVEAGRRATTIDPFDAAGFVGLAGGLAMTGDPEGARSALARASTLNPSSPTACFANGFGHFGSGLWDDAIPLFERALRLSPRDPVGHHMDGMLAGCLLMVGRNEDAIVHARRSLEREPPAGISYHPYLIAALVRSGREDEAREEATRMKARGGHWNLDLARMVVPAEMVDMLLASVAEAGWETSTL